MLTVTVSPVFTYAKNVLSVWIVLGNGVLAAWAEAAGIRSVANDSSAAMSAPITPIDTDLGARIANPLLPGPEPADNLT
ncbi:hypothetical protein ACSAGD_11405 [Paramicrobacterium sp. CJ85]|uniref:hypothetical protein n=1 Tax=Paramicrobacterium sp. CJ85 TaxID=3445355 RepID=UPI003F64464A